MLINHRQSSTAFVCFLTEENNLAFGVHRPMLPSSIKIVRKLVELTKQYLLIILCGYCQHSGKCHKKSEAIAQTLVFYTIRAKKKKEKTRGWVPETKWDPGSILWRAFFFFPPLFFFSSPLSPRLAFLFFPSFFLL